MFYLYNVFESIIYLLNHALFLNRSLISYYISFIFFTYDVVLFITEFGEVMILGRELL